MRVVVIVREDDSDKDPECVTVPLGDDEGVTDAVSVTVVDAEAEAEPDCVSESEGDTDPVRVAVADADPVKEFDQLSDADVDSVGDCEDVDDGVSKERDAVGVCEGVVDVDTDRVPRESVSDSEGDPVPG